MTDRPILYNAPMVRALLEGRKTQTRRIVKPQPKGVDDARYIPRVYWPSRDTHMSAPCPGPAYMQFERPGEYDGRHVGEYGFSCPYGQPGDRLWVRETFYIDQTPYDEGPFPKVRPADLPQETIYYRADGECCEQIPECCCAEIGKPRWRPSIHMPRWASRITLEITGIRVEHLNDISEGDAKAEGLTARSKDGTLVKYGIPDRDGLPGTDDDGWPWQQWDKDPRVAFLQLWESVYGPGSVMANPCVWVVEFKRVEVSHA